MVRFSVEERREVSGNGDACTADGEQVCVLSLGAVV